MIWFCFVMSYSNTSSCFICVRRGVSFQGTIIGLAPLKAMCSEYQSGGVNSVKWLTTHIHCACIVKHIAHGVNLFCLPLSLQDHSDIAVGIAATMAHEMGHNFGMNHDPKGCCLTQPEDGGCIMAAATGWGPKLAALQIRLLYWGNIWINDGFPQGSVSSCL